MIISFKSRNVQVFDDGVHEWMTKKGDSWRREKPSTNSIEKSADMLLLVVRPICKKRCFKWAAAAALDRGYIYLYKSLSKSFEANSFPISWQKGFALYVEIYIHTDLSPCVSFGLFSLYIQIHIRGCRLSSRSKRSKDLDVFLSFLICLTAAMTSCVPYRPAHTPCLFPVGGGGWMALCVLFANLYTYYSSITSRTHTRPNTGWSVYYTRIYKNKL